MLIKSLTFETEYERCYDITAYVQELVDKSGVKDGVCVVTARDWCVGLGLPSKYDKKGWVDTMDDMHRLIADRVDFKNQSCSPRDEAAKLRAAFLGSHSDIIVRDGKLVLGNSQGLLLHEFGFDGNERTIDVCIM
ncbi:MAG: YjbQ family protein [Oscillospiraceae bacterium]|jgi:secondary thiamine-phosphate synthase enzyme